MPEVVESTLRTICPATNCTTAMRFVDTNILVYAVSPLADEREKQRISRELLSEGAGNLVVSIQVLGEFYAQTTRVSRPGALTHFEALAFIRELKHHHVQPLTEETFGVAMHYRESFALSYWDCLILAAAKLSGCDAVYSEDMSASQEYDGVRVINPFEEASEPALA